MTTILVTSEYRVAAGETLAITNEDGFILRHQYPNGWPTVTIAGTVVVSRTVAGQYSGLVGISVPYAGSYALPIRVESTGLFRVESTIKDGGVVVGYQTVPGGPDFQNLGRVEIVGVGSVVGVTGAAVFNNQGTFTANASQDIVTGVAFYAGGQFINHGLVEVSGRHAVAVYAPDAASAFLNTGTIRAIGLSSGGTPAAYAVEWTFGAASGPWTNSGVIEGATNSLWAFAAGSRTAPIDYANSGTMKGLVELTSVRDVFTNSGSIQAAMNLGAGDDQYDGRLGSVTGMVSGGEGADTLTGGAVFDYLHGNQGDDSAAGGAGDDWVVGGKDNDALFGDEGGDVVWGNLGNDTCDGGTGNDQVRGGQGDDIVRGGAGDDWLSGDRGTDTITGGAGADIFHTFDGAGSDRVTDFNAGEGDRVYVLAGHQYSVAQVGADTVVTVTGAEGATLTLVGVTLSTLPDGWIFGG